MRANTQYAIRNTLSALTAKIPRHVYFQAAALLLACAAAWPLLSETGLLNTRGGGDSPFLLQRLHQLEIALLDGHFPVRWMADANYGYGYPFFHYYAPLSLYVAAAFRLLGFGYVGAIKMAQLAGFLLAAWGAFHLARRWFHSEWAGLLAAAAYTLAPFHLVNVYVRGDSLAEFWAMALYPLLLLAAEGVVGGRSRATTGRSAGGGWRVVGLALAYAALVLCHNISALIFTPFLLLYVALRHLRLRRHSAILRQAQDRFSTPSASSGQVLQSLTPTIVALLLGLALSAWFWLPALAETGLVQTEPVTAGYFHYGNHFWGWDLVQRAFFFDYEVAGRNAFRMGLVQTLLIAAGLVALIWHRRRRSPGHPHTPSPPHPFIITSLLVATAMITPLSRPVWDHLPLLPFVQFPWRFLSVQALAGALAAGALALLPLRRLLVPAGIALLLITALGRLQTDHLSLADADVTAERLAQYEWFTGNVGSTVSAEYLPQAVQPRPATSPWLETGARNRVQVLGGAAEVTLVERRATQQRWQVAAHGDGAELVFPTLYWPGWRATVDGEPAAIGPAPGSGLIALRLPDRLPAGSPSRPHTITLTLGRTPLRLAAEVASLLALLGMVGYWLLEIGDWRLEIRRQSPISNPPLLLAALLLLAIAGRLWPQPTLAPGTLTWDFAQMGYLHHAPAGVPFADGSTLRGYEYSADTVRAGDTVTVTLAWGPSSGSGGPLTLALATPAVHRVPHAPLLATATQPLAQEVAFTLAIPENVPAGLVVPRLTLAGTHALTPAGQRRGDLFLRPLRIAGANDIARTSAPLDVRVEQAEVRGETPTQSENGNGLFDCAAGETSSAALQLRLAWATQEPLTHNVRVSLRLADADGAEIAQCDSQPGYGFQPSSGWPPGRWVHDWLALPLPPALPPAAPYAVIARLYDPAGQTVLVRRLGELAWQEGALRFRPVQPSFTVPAGITPLAATFGDVIALRGYTLAQQENQLQLTLVWQALQDGAVDVTRFVHVVDPAGGQNVAQADGVPRNGSYPTSQWVAGEVVAERVLLDVDGVPAGAYTIALGFYRNEGELPRLPVIDGQGRPRPDGRLFLPQTITIP